MKKHKVVIKTAEDLEKHIETILESLDILNDHQQQMMGVLRTIEGKGSSPTTIPMSFPTSWVSTGTTTFTGGYTYLTGTSNIADVLKEPDSKDE